MRLGGRVGKDDKREGWGERYLKIFLLKHAV